MMELWKIENGIIRVGNVYYGKNGAKYGTKEGLLPFDDIDDSVQLRYPVKQKVYIVDDWIFFSGINRAYKKDGHIIQFTMLGGYRDHENLVYEAMRDVEKRINKKYPFALVERVYKPLEDKYELFTTYDFFVDDNFKPVHGVGKTRVFSSNPEKAIGLAKEFKNITGLYPDWAYSDYAIKYDHLATENGLKDLFVGYNEYGELFIGMDDITVGISKDSIETVPPEFSGESKCIEIGNCKVYTVFGSPIMASCEDLLIRQQNETKTQFFERVKKHIQKRENSKTNNKVKLIKIITADEEKRIYKYSEDSIQKIKAIFERAKNTYPSKFIQYDEFGSIMEAPIGYIQELKEFAKIVETVMPVAHFAIIGNTVYGDEVWFTFEYPIPSDDAVTYIRSHMPKLPSYKEFVLRELDKLNLEELDIEYFTIDLS